MILPRGILKRYLEINKGPDVIPKNCQTKDKRRYFVNDPSLRLYEFFRDIKVTGLSVMAAARKHRFTEQTFRVNIGTFLQQGVVALLKIEGMMSIPSEIEHAVITLKRHNRRMSHLGILRFLHKVQMDYGLTVGTISNILASHGLTITKWKHFDFTEFQQLLRSVVRMRTEGLPFKRNGKAFMDPADIHQERLEMLRKAALAGSGSVASICRQYGVSRVSFYNLHRRFLNYGVLGVFNKAGGMTENIKVTPSIEIDIVFRRLRRPDVGVQKITTSVRNIKKSTVHRVLQLWGLSNYKGPSISFDRLCIN